VVALAVVVLIVIRVVGVVVAPVEFVATVCGNKKTPLQKLQYLQNGVIFLYEIFSDYYGENLL